MVGDFGFVVFCVFDIIQGIFKLKDEVIGEDMQGKGDLIMGMFICNDRCWVEGWRFYGFQGIEILLVSFLEYRWFKCFVVVVY